MLAPLVFVAAVCGTAPPAPTDVGIAAAPQGHRTIFMNRAGGTYVPGPNDSSANTSSIPDMVSVVAPYPNSEASWQALMECERAMWAPFNATVTDVDPGTAQHIEVVMGGAPEDVGLSADEYWGVSPSTCDVIERSVVYVFAGVIPDDPQLLCEIAAQEVGHSFGLDHEMLCSDPMTYLPACGPQTFQDVEAPCGEYAERPCACGLAAQNSFARLRQVLGAPELEPPALEVLEPRDGDSVPLGFSVLVAVSDNVRVLRTELLVDGEVRATSTQPPYTLDAPGDVALGLRQLEVRALDPALNVASVTLSVNVVPGCAADAECPVGDVCVEQACLGDVGTLCQAAADCAGGLCLADGVDRFCSLICAGDSECPDGFHCAKDAIGGSVMKCYPAEPGGCALGSRGRAGAAWAVVLAVAVLLRSRRRA